MRIGSENMFSYYYQRGITSRKSVDSTLVQKYCNTEILFLFLSVYDCIFTSLPCIKCKGVEVYLSYSLYQMPILNIIWESTSEWRTPCSRALPGRCGNQRKAAQMIVVVDQGQRWEIIQCLGSYSCEDHCVLLLRTWIICFYFLTVAAIIEV